MQLIIRNIYLMFQELPLMFIELSDMGALKSLIERISIVLNELILHNLNDHYESVQ